MAKSKKIINNFDLKKVGLVAGGITLLFVLVLQSVFIVNLYHRAEATKIKNLIVNAVEDLEDPHVIDPETGKEYIPSARLVLPPRGSLSVAYYGDEEMVHFNDRLNVSNATSRINSAKNVDAVFKNVPQLQACSRQLTVQFEQGGIEEFELIHSKKLADGRVAYIHKSIVCQGDSKELEEYVKSLESY